MKKSNLMFAIAFVATYFFIPLLGGVGVGFAQVGINTTGNSPDASSMLDVAADGATKGGMLIPRVSLTSTTDVTTIATPANALMVYNTNAAMTNGNGAGFYYYNTTASKWIFLNTAANGPGTAGQVLTSQGGGVSELWSTLSLSSACLPVAVSNTYWTSVTWQTCGLNCAALTEGSQPARTWRMPTIEEYAYATFNLPAPTGGWLNQYFWTRVVYPNTDGSWLLFIESNGNWHTNTYTSSYYCRCVR